MGGVSEEQVSPPADPGADAATDSVTPPEATPVAPPAMDPIPESQGRTPSGRLKTIRDALQRPAPSQTPLQQRVDHVLNQPDSFAGRVAELSIGSLILFACALYVVHAELIGTAYADWIPLVNTIETVVTIVFLVEYLVRWWARAFSVRYLFTPMALVDLVAILPLFLPGGQLHFVRVLRMFRVLRLLRLLQSRKFFFGEVTQDHLLVMRIMFTIGCLVFLTGGLVYECEKHVPGTSFVNLHDSFYFALVTLTTVGFGDMTPATFAGRAVTMAMILLGVMIIPWQLTNLARQVVRSSNKVDVMCKHCGLKGHDADASHCKSCGNLIFQEYDGG
jgi:voltage-gated potassium channel